MKLYQFLIIVFFIFSCSSSEIADDINNNNQNNDNNSNDQVSSSWSIPVDEIFDAAGRDGIPSLDNPVFLQAQNAVVDSYMNSEDLVIGIKLGNEVRAYPHRILDWHEIANDNFNGQKITINYCPLTRTAFAWKYASNANSTEFGVSGLLYNSNLILYDRNTNSNWSQMKLECVNGPESGNRPTLIQIVETTWQNWKNMYPETKILSNQQGLNRNYLSYPYGGYLGSDSFLFFPVSPLDTRLPNKERVHGVINNNLLKAYQFNNFSGGKVFKDNFSGNKLLLVGNEDVIKSFIIPQDLQGSTYIYTYNNTEEFFIDSLGNKWSINGEVIEGPMLGRKMLGIKSVTGFWFSLASFYPNPEIY